MFKRTLATTAVVVATLGALGAQPVAADPVLIPTTDVGAQAVDAEISNPSSPSYPATTKSPTSCQYTYATPPTVAIKHVSPCGSATTGTGTATKPWRTLAQAFAALQAGDTLYVHDATNLPNDYTESNLRPANGGTSASARIRVMAAPNETPQVAKLGSATGVPIFHINKPWWFLDGLSIDGTGVSGAAVVRVGPDHPVTTNDAHHIVLRKLTAHNGGTAKAFVSFDGAQNSALLTSVLSENVDATTGRPSFVPTNTSDHHGTEVINQSNKILLKGNDSSGHNGDSAQCGEGSDGTTAPQNLTIENNKFHQDEENAVDLKSCHGVTIRGNKFFGYAPARPYAANRAPQGDAVVVHYASPDGINYYPAKRVLLEQNRLWDNSRSINVADRVDKSVIRRNLIFRASANNCGIGAGIYARGNQVEIYQNTLDVTVAPPTIPGTGCTTWSNSEKVGVRLAAPGAADKAVLWNNIIVRDTAHLTISTPNVDAHNNLFNVTPSTLPADSFIGDPLFVDDPVSNDFYTKQGSKARDNARTLPAGVGDTTVYCDDKSVGEPDLVIEPDIGFLESCS
jgi:hypothetical protein